MTGARDLTLTRIEAIVVEMIGEEAAMEGVFCTDRKVWISDLNFTRASCPTCGQEFVGPDYNVYHMVAVHAYGHQFELEQAARNAAMEDHDDEERGGVSA